MTTERIKDQSRRFGCGLFIFLLLLALTGSASAEIIPANRRIQWDPGVRGDIPSRTTVFANVKNSPYNAKGDGSTDDTAAIQNAINACPSGQVVYIPAGTYRITSTITVKANITVRGAGLGASIIKGASGFSQADMLIFQSGNPDFDFTWANPAFNLTSSGLTKGSTSITTSAAHNWKAGDYILIDQLNNPSGDPPIDSNGNAWLGRQSGTRPIGQWVKVTAVPTATTATIDPPLYWSWDATKSPQAVKVNAPIESSGLEDLTIDCSVAASSMGSMGRPLFWSYAVNCWLLRVEVKGIWYRGLWMYGGLWNTIRSCLFHDGVPTDPIISTRPSNYDVSRAYGIFMGPWASACLTEDSIFHRLVLGVATEGATSGNVFAYNYCTNMRWWDPGVGRINILGHGSHTFMELLEGNWLEGRFGVDSYFGTQSHFTLFRNKVTQQVVDGYGNPVTYQTWTVDIERRDWYCNVVGNILGTLGVEQRYELSNQSYSEPIRTLYRLGYDTTREDTVNWDAGAKSTLLRHGNWDSVNKSTVWDPAISDRNLPPSLYRTTKPSWWGSLPWPAIGPDLSPTEGALPARVRFLGGGLQPPTNLRITSQ